MVSMAREWLDEEFRRAPEREEQRHLAAQHRLYLESVIARNGPDVMRRLLDEVDAVVAEYRRESRISVEVGVERLPQEGFSITTTGFPRMYLECRPEYTAQVVCCNLSRTDDAERDTRELIFNLHFTVDDHEHVGLRHEARIFQTVDAAVQFLLRPVLFPAADPSSR
jgi:hypothetical protein